MDALTRELNMNPISWIAQMVRAHGHDVPPELNAIIERGLEDQSPYAFMSKEWSDGALSLLMEQYTARRVTPFAYDWGQDNVICIVIGDEEYPKGSILSIHWNTWPGVEVDESFPDIATWAKVAQQEIDLMTEYKANPDAFATTAPEAPAHPAQPHRTPATPVAWLAPAIENSGFAVPEQLASMLATGTQVHLSYYLLDQTESEDDTSALEQLLPGHGLLAFARLFATNGVFCLVLHGAEHEQGSVLLLHERADDRVELITQYPTLDAWAQRANDLIQARRGPPTQQVPTDDVQPSGQPAPPGRVDPLRRYMEKYRTIPSPMNVVQTPDGLVSLDNTRLALARELGVPRVSVWVRAPGDPLPPTEQTRFRGAASWGEVLARMRLCNTPGPSPAAQSAASLPPAENPIAWIASLAADQGCEIGAELATIIGRGQQEQAHITLSTKAESQLDEALVKQTYPRHDVIPFGRMFGKDGVLCLVVSEGDDPKGAVLHIHWDTLPATEVDEHHASLAAWAKAAQHEMDAWHNATS